MLHPQPLGPDEKAMCSSSGVGRRVQRDAIHDVPEVMPPGAAIRSVVEPTGEPGAHLVVGDARSGVEIGDAGADVLEHVEPILDLIDGHIIGESGDQGDGLLPGGLQGRRLADGLRDGKVSVGVTDATCLPRAFAAFASPI